MNFSSTPVLRKLIALFLIIAGLYFARHFLMPLAVAGLLAALFYPMCAWMERKKIHRVLAALLCVFILMLAIAIVFAVIGWQVSELSHDLGMIRKHVAEFFSRAQNSIYSNLGISVSKQDKLLKEQQFDLGNAVSAGAGSIAIISTGFILMLVYIVLLLYYRSHLKAFVLKLTAPHQKEEMKTVVYNVTEVAHQYLFGLIKMIVCLWIMYSIGFSIVGVKNFIFFAVLCGILEIVPFIGNITGTTITVLVSLIQGGSPAMLGGIVITYSIVQFIQGWVLEPLIVGPQVKINAFATIVALVIGNLIWGIPGVILAIPLTGMLKIVFDHVEAWKPYGFLIGDIDTGKPSRFKIIVEKLRKKWKN
jgi:predicted PurR-regulated permease PerM